MFAYTYTLAKDITANPGSAAYSAFSSNTAVGSLNDPGLSYSNFATPHKLIGNISYRIEYAKHLATTISLVYQDSRPDAGLTPTPPILTETGSLRT